MRNRLSPRVLFLASAFTAVSLFLGGCNSEPNKEPDTDESGQTAQKGTDAPESEESYVQQVNQLFEQAKNTGQTTASNAGEWINDTFSNAMAATGNAAQDTGDWVNDTFHSLKDRGMTTATDATEWVQEDIQNMNAFEYKILNRSEGVDEEKLNELGKQRWECIAVDDSAFYFKRQRKSYLKNVPVKDLLKFIPLSGGGGGDESP